MRFARSLLVASFGCSLLACNDEPYRRPRTPPPPAPPEEEVASNATSSAATSATQSKPKPEDTYTLAEAVEGLEGSGPLVATITTSMGALKCSLFDDRAPITVANFVGLARGKRKFRDPRIGNWHRHPAYDGTTFHRVIPGFVIQGGDPNGNGSGEPGYVFDDENWRGAKHDRAGLLAMANRGPNTNGMQFFITDAPTPKLDGGYTIFGECEPTALIHAIANVPKGEGDKPYTDVKIETITIARRNGSPERPASDAGGVPSAPPAPSPASH